MARSKEIRNNKLKSGKQPAPISRKARWLTLSLILLITLIVFAPTAQYDFVNWDDDVNITQNRNVLNLNKESVKAIFSSTVIGGYTPLTTLTFAIEHHFFGLNPAVFHINNILLHLACTALVFVLLKHLNVSFFATVLVTLLFGIHPMRVESVAWITERKDLLYAFFYFGSAIAYIRFSQNGRLLLYFLALVLFVLSLLSKIQAVSLPLALILIDYYSDKKIVPGKLWNKLPFLALSLATGMAGIFFLGREGSLDTGSLLPVYQRIFIGSYSFMVYFIKSLFPYEMSAIYPFPAKLSPFHYLSLPVTLIVAFLIWKARKISTEIVFGTLFFFVNVVFVLQVIGAGQGYLADRFTYVGYAGLFLIFALTAEKLVQSRWKVGIYVSLSVYLFILAVWTHNRVKVWENSETLFTDVIKKYPRVAVAHNNMGRYFRELNQYDKAIASYNKAIEINPEGFNTLNNRGKALFDLGRTEEALTDFDRSIELNGEFAESRSNRGAALAARGRYAESLIDLNKAIELDPYNINAISNRTLTMYSMNNFGKAAEDATEFLRIKPDDADMLNLRSLCYNNLNRDQEALADLNKAIALLPAQGVFRQNRSLLRNKTGDTKGALEDILKARELGIEVNPAYVRMLETRLQNSGAAY
jgi:protein O-mannosyl-transferase